MTLHSMLLEGREGILADAVAAVHRAHLAHYDLAATDTVRQRLDVLLTLTLDALRDRTLAAVVAHAEAVAQARFEAGVDLVEVQTAYNVLEEILWRRILAQLPAAAQGEALGLVATVLGAGKDALARKYVSLASRTHTPPLDLQALFSGTQGL